MSEKSNVQKLEGETVIVVFGASGDLASKSTFPALYALLLSGNLPSTTKIIGYARSEMSRDKFEKQLLGGIEEDEEGSDGKQSNSEKKEEFKKMAQYVQGAYDEDEGYQNLEKELEKIEKEDFDGKKSNRVFYLALPPSSFVQVAQMLKKNNYSKESVNRLVIEKPFGKDTDSCQEMMDKITKDWKEDEIYRIDHYLGEEMIRMLYHLRFANAFVDPMLNNGVVESISIIMKEMFGAEGRGGYFDEFGMIRDVAQNHLLQAISILTMEPPKSLKDDGLRDNKVELLKAIPPVKKEDVLLGQYGAHPSDKEKKAYVDDETVPDDSKTATFAEFAMQIDNDRWKGVPIVVKCGKALDEGLMEMKFNFKMPEHNILEVEKPSSLVIQLNPVPSIYFESSLLKPGSLTAETTRAKIAWTVPGKKVMGDKKAYEIVILNVLKGETSSFVREDELIAGWKIFTPILQWIEGKDGPTPEQYAYGSEGPKGIEDFEKRFGVWKAKETEEDKKQDKL